MEHSRIYNTSCLIRKLFITPVSQFFRKVESLPLHISETISDKEYIAQKYLKIILLGEFSLILVKFYEAQIYVSEICRVTH